MNENKSTKGQFLSRDGQNQSQRFPKELDPYYAKIDEKTRKDLLKYAEEMSDQVNFYSTINNSVEGNWSVFFENAWTEANNKLKNYGKHKPHLALYLAFLLIYRHAQKSINKITKRHLDFYYKEVLKLQNKAETPDEVHVLFELKKGVDEQLIEEGTLLKAGKDSSGIELLYETKNDIIVTDASVAKIQSVYTNTENNSKITCAPIANSADGLGKELEEGDSWSAFGDPDHQQADIGFGVASEILELSEGVRTVTITINTLSKEKMESTDFNLEAYFTGEKGWIGPIDCSSVEYVKKDDYYNYDLSFILDEEDEAVTTYSSKIHGGTYETTLPFMQIFLKKTSGTYSYKKLSTLKISNIKIKVDVTGVKSLDLENDLGTINPKKPFLPFGTEPVKGSTFTVGSEEIFSKSVEKFKLHLEWNKIPDNGFSTHYTKYVDANNKTIVSSNNYFTASLYDQNQDLLSGTVTLFYSTPDGTDSIPPSKILIDSGNITTQQKLVSTGLNVMTFMTNTWALSKQKNITLTSKILNVDFSKSKQKQTETVEKAKKSNVQLVLNQSFLHKEYRQLYAKTVVDYAKSGSGGVSLPNEPYTPELNSLTLDYLASTREENLLSTTESIFLSSEVEFYHITPFGQRREHAFIKDNLEYTEPKSVYLLHQYNCQGELYIGIEDAESESEIPLLFQLAEGSADPESTKEDLQWEILADNHWKKFTESQIVSDTTNDLLTSGIIRFTLPKEATSKNTLLDSGYYWIRTYLTADVNAVCRFIDIEPNACLAVFQNNDNELSHLKTSLPAKSIKKMVEPVSTIKKISQPYASFNGYAAEADESFYTRISERLRHKHRAVTIWDYERIILQAFPNVYKVKAIPHCSRGYEFAPGYVTLVVVPNLTNKNAVNKLQPKVDLNTISEITDYVKKLTSYFANVNVQNPEYEQVLLSFKVKMNKGYPFGYYSNILQQDIIEFLCPWINEKVKDIKFEGTVHKSVLLNYIEKREYVDYVSDFKMYSIPEEYDVNAYQLSLGQLKDVNSIDASSPRSILVSTEQHLISSI